MIYTQPDFHPLIKDLVKGTRQKSISSGQIILYEDDPIHDIYIIKSGVVKLYDIDELGNEKVLHLVKAPALIPFAFFSGLENSLKWFYEALTDCDLYAIPADELQEKLQENGELSLALTHNFSIDVHELLVRLSSLGKSYAQDKVVAVLRFLMTCHANDHTVNWRRVNFSINHQLIANICGITRESAALVMKELEGKKIIKYPKLNVLDINKTALESYSPVTVD